MTIHHNTKCQKNWRAAAVHWSIAIWLIVPFGNLLGPLLALSLSRDNAIREHCVSAWQFQLAIFCLIASVYIATGLLFGFLLPAIFVLLSISCAAVCGHAALYNRQRAYPLRLTGTPLVALLVLAAVFALPAYAAIITSGGTLVYGKSNWPPPSRPWGFTIAFSDGPWGEAAEAAAFVYKNLQGPAEPEAARPEEFYEQGSKWSPLYYAENKKSGFYAAALKYDDGTIGIAFRGTSSWTDALVDLLMGFGIKHQQFHDAEEFYENALTRFGSLRLFVTGHSLGGSLAQYIGAKYKTKAVTFDPYGVSRFVHSPVDDSTARNIVNFAMDFDPVSTVRFPYTFGELVDASVEFLTGQASNHVGCIVRMEGVLQGWSFWRPFEWHSVETLKDRIHFYLSVGSPSSMFTECIKQPPRWKQYLLELGFIK
jgi:uncharacterized Tic20 family protein